MSQVIVLAMHGAPPSDFPEVEGFFVTFVTLTPLRAHDTMGLYPLPLGRG